jgi:hypothetical protein
VVIELRGDFRNWHIAAALVPVENDPKRAYSAYIGGCRIASFSGKINERSFFRQRGLAHAVHEALALLQENGIVALSAETKTANGSLQEAWRDHQVWTAEKYRRFDRGERMPPDWRPSRQ